MPVTPEPNWLEEQDAINAELIARTIAADVIQCRGGHGALVDFRRPYEGAPHELVLSQQWGALTYTARVIIDVRPDPRPDPDPEVPAPALAVTATMPAVPVIPPEVG